MTRLYAGDLVEVKSPGEILETLTADGTLNGLPFMPEMVQWCGQQFRVSMRAVKTCYTGPNASSRAFKDNDVVLLDGLRCSGDAHDGCEKACTIFWREAWLRKAGTSPPVAQPDPDGMKRLRSRLKTSTAPDHYFCQSSELLKVTKHLSRLGRYLTAITELRERNCTVPQLLQRLAMFAAWKLRRKIFGEYARGNKARVLCAPLNLQAGERVAVKPMESIRETLDENGCHRGLYFFAGMHLLCGTESRVKGRIDKIILDGTGKMRQLRDTVQLEGSLCGCPYVSAGGCSRSEVAYWREAWLSRPAPDLKEPGGPKSH